MYIIHQTVGFIFNIKLSREVWRFQIGNNVDKNQSNKKTILKNWSSLFDSKDCIVRVPKTIWFPYIFLFTCLPSAPMHRDVLKRAIKHSSLLLIFSSSHHGIDINWYYKTLNISPINDGNFLWNINLGTFTIFLFSGGNQISNRYVNSYCYCMSLNPNHLQHMPHYTYC